MPRQTVISEMGPARGIWQGSNPPAGTVYDCCNIDISRGYWETRPAFHPASFYSIPYWTAKGIAEYIADPKYSTSSYMDMMVVIGDSEYSGYMEGLFFLNYSEIPKSNYIASGVPRGKMQHARCLWKRTDAYGTKYGPALVFVGEGIAPIIYHQFDELANVSHGKIEKLDSIDGGFSDVSYLPTPPSGKYCANYKGRLFIGSCSDAANRLWFTAPDSGGAFVCNVWPTSYNIDVGKDPITGLAVWKDYLLVFNSHEIYALSGDGAGGAWEVTLVDDAHGALDGNSIVSAGDEIYFLSESGIYRFNGKTENISHPAIQDIWRDVIATDGGDSTPFACYDRSSQNVMFFVKTFGPTCDSILVYNRKYQGWTRWGRIYSSETTDSTSLLYNGAVFSERLGRVVIASDLYCILGDHRVEIVTTTPTGDEDRSPLDDYPIPFFIKTQRYFANDPHVKLFRNFAITAARTYQCELTSNPINMIVLADGESISDAIISKSIGTTGLVEYAIINDETNDRLHRLSRTPSFNSDTGIYDVYYIPLGAIIATDRATFSEQTKTVNFRLPLNSNGMAGELYVVHSRFGYVHSIYPSIDTRYIPGIEKNNRLELLSQQPVRIATGINKTGRSVSFFLSSNIAGEVAGGKSKYRKIIGWDITVQPIGTLRQ